ncbi:DHH family phosphoesterase [Candidatus Peregrinibacteria bacterium]|nr:DHH family phosphoesterase [Candidatus Peregrinibacteria bacterium]
MPEVSQKAIIELIKRSNRILILPSSPPDGDSLGSAVALYLALKKLDKEVTVISSEPVPQVYDFLPNIQIIGNKLASTNDFIITIDCRKVKVEKVKHSIEDDKVNIVITPESGKISENDISLNKGKAAYDLIITVDCAELSQLREIYENNIEIFHQIPVINIDHHISNAHFGKINYVDIMSSSTTELLFPLFQELGRQNDMDLIDEDIATLLLTGIITDTGSFQNANTTPKSFEVSSELIALGARQQEIIQYIYKTKQLSQLKLWGRILSKIQTDDKYRIVWSVVSQQDFRDTGSSPEQTGDLIDELMTNATGAEVVILIKEQGDGIISGSIRTTSPVIDASKIAEQFGGGGHTQAAGFQMPETDLRSAEFKIIEGVKKYQENRIIAVGEITKFSQTTSQISSVQQPTTTAVKVSESGKSLKIVESGIGSFSQTVHLQPQTSLSTAKPQSEQSSPSISAFSTISPSAPVPPKKSKKQSPAYGFKPQIPATEKRPDTPGYKFED